MSTGFKDGASRVGGGARTAANDAGAPAPQGYGNMMGNPYGSGAGAGFAGGAGYPNGMGSNYGSMGPGTMNNQGMAAAAPNGEAKPNAVGMSAGNGMYQSNGNMDMGNSLYGMPGGGAGGYGPGGYGMGGSMYGGGSMYNVGGEENIIVTKVFSSRRDMDSVASGVDFPRRFDSQWPSYRSDGGEAAPMSAYKNSMYDGNGKTSMIETRDAAAPEPSQGVGAAGEGPDGKPTAIVEEKKPEVKPAPEAQPASKAQPTPAAREAPQPSNDKGKEKEEETKRKADEEERKRRGEAAAAAAVEEKKRKEKELADKKQPAAETKPTPQPVKKAEPTPSKAAEPKPAPSKKPAEVRKPQPASPAKAPVQQEVQKARELPRKEEEDIPLLKDDVQPPPPQPQKAEPPKKAEEAPVAKPVEEKAEPTRAPPQESNVGGDRAHPVRPSSSRRPSRPVSRSSAVDLVDFPVAEEVPDELNKSGLTDPAKQALEQARADRQKEREAQRVARQQQRAAQSEAERARDEAARQRRENEAAEQRAKREAVAKMDEDRRKARAAALEAREADKEAERKKFEDAKAAEEAKEAARVHAVMEARQREVAKEGEVPDDKSQGRSASRPRSRRPPSRPTSSLRGAIPEQPPDVEAGQMKDVMADELSKGSHAVISGNPAKPNGAPAPAEAETPAHGSDRAAAQPATQPTAEVRRSGSDQRPAHKAGSPSSAEAKKASGSPPTAKKASSPSSAEQGRTGAARGAGAHPTTPGSSQPAGATPKSQANAGDKPSGRENPITTLVLLEKLNRGNKAVTAENNTVEWQKYPLKVTETKTREDGGFQYSSELVHRVCEVATKGYNVAVLSNEAPNTVSRCRSPVWPVLVRVMQTVLKEKTGSNGRLRDGVDIKCVLAYANGDKVKDLASDDSTFGRVPTSSSPISGVAFPSLVQFQVTDIGSFEEHISTKMFRAGEDPIVASLTSGVAIALVSIQEHTIENGVSDVCFSSILVSAAGSDTAPYEAGLSRAHDLYGAIFHLAILGPCFTMYMANMSDDDTITQAPVPEGSSVHNEIVSIFRMLERMTKTENLPIRNGSARRFLGYLIANRDAAKSRLANSDGSVPPEKREKMEKYVVESDALIAKYQRMLDDKHEL